LNSIFAPGGGHQPLAHDQWATFYNRYVVFGVHVHVEYIATGTTNNIQHVAIAATNSSTPITEVSTAAEQQHGSVAKISNINSAGVVFTKYVDLRTIYGTDAETIRSDDTYSATFAASPAKAASLHILSSNNGVLTFSSLVCVTLTYDCEFFSPIQLAQS